MANELIVPSESFLKVPCKHYLETMIYSYDVLRSEMRVHMPFFIYWSECVETKPSALNAMRFAFAYYNKKDNDPIDEISEKRADEYLEALIRYYNSEYPDIAFGKHVAQFIRGFKSNTGRTEIKTDDFEWFPKDNVGNGKLPKEFEPISKEFDFAWKCARLWQLLKERKQEYYILSFLGINETNFTEVSRIPSDILSKLNESTIEEPDFFKKIVDYFTPEQMTMHDMSLLLKKACRASINKQLNEKIVEISPSNARIKPLDSLWLLARFYGIHYYRLDFIGQKMSPRAIKQFEGIDGDSPFLEWNEKNLDKVINRSSVKVGNRTYPLAEVLMTVYPRKELLDSLEYKSNEIIEGKERNPYKPVYQAILEQDSCSAAISHLDLSDENLRKFAKKRQGVFKAMIVVGSFLDSKYEAVVENDESILEENTNNKILKTFFANTLVTEGLENPKNVFFITEDDFDNRDVVLALLLWLAISPKLLQNKIDKQESKQIAASS